MKEQIYRLVKLQKIETEQNSIKSSLQSVSKKIEDLDAGLNKYQEEIEIQKMRLNELKQEYRSHESDTQMNLSLIEKSEEKLSAVKTNKEYQSSLKEIEVLKAKNSQIEDEMILCLDRIDKTERIIEAKKNEYSKQSEKIGRKKEDIRQKADQDKKKLAELDEKWNGISSTIDPELMEKFSQIKKQQKNRIAIAPAVNFACKGCNMNIPPQMYNELQRFDSLRFCPFCNRIIYWHKQS